MSGIIGYIGNKRVVPVLLEGLQRLQYRGYDSAGLAVMQDGELRSSPLHRQAAQSAKRRFASIPWTAATASGTRAGPRTARPRKKTPTRIAIAINASRWFTTASLRTICELKKQLESEGHKFSTETDTEVIAHLVEKHLERQWRPAACKPVLEDAVRAAVRAACGSVRARHHFHPGPEQDRRRAAGAAGGDRSGQGRILCGERRPGHSLPHARPVFSCRRRRGRAHPDRREPCRLRRPSRHAARAAHHLGPRSWRRRAASSTSR